MSRLSCRDVEIDSHVTTSGLSRRDVGTFMSRRADLELLEFLATSRRALQLFGDVVLSRCDVILLLVSLCFSTLYFPILAQLCFILPQCLIFGPNGNYERKRC